MSTKLVTHQFKVMGGPAEFQLYLNSSHDRNVIQFAEQEARRLEKKYSRYRNDSVTTAINLSAGNSSGIDIDEETTGLLNYANIAWEQSEGLFDITSGVLRQAWDFKSNNLPTQEELSRLLPRVGWDKLIRNGSHLILPDEMEIDFGGIVKEYAADAIVALLRSYGIEHGLVELAGDIGVIGPHPDGSPWKIGVRNPLGPEEPIATIDVIKGGLASSGNYERYMLVDGKRYCHILNPKNGWPVNGVAGVSVHSSTCIVAGTAATIAMLLGDPAGKQWLENGGFEHILLSE